MPTIKYVFGGVNNVLDPMELGAIEDARRPLVSEMISASNVDISDRRAVRRRKGYTSVLASTTAHSLWATTDETQAFYVDSGYLKRLNSDYTGTNITAVTANTKMAFCEVNNVIAYSNGVDFGVIDGGVVSAAGPTDKVGRIPTRPGNHLAFFNSRIYIGTDWGLYYTDPYDIDYMDEGNCRIPMGGTVTMVAPVVDGLWVGLHDKIIFLPGGDATELSWIQAANYGVIPHAYNICDATRVGQEKGTGNVVVFASTRGICVGGPGGQFANLSIEKLSYRPGQSGAVLTRESEGQVHHIAAMQNPGTAFNKDTGSVTPDIYPLN